MLRFNPRISSLLALSASLILSFALFGNGIKGDYVFDDKIVILGNPHLEERPPSLIDIFSDSYHAYQPTTGLYRPLTIASFALNTYMFGTSPVSFHVFNIILHALVGFMIYVIVGSLADMRTAVVSALLFLFLPIHVEDVTSLVGRAELLALLFSLVALYAVMRGKYHWGALAFLLGLFSKESAIAFIPIWLSWEYFFNKQTIRTILKRFLIMLPAISIYAVLRYLALGKYVLANDATAVYNPLKFAPFFDTLWTSGKIAFLYIQKMLVPTVFSSDYSFNQIPVVHNPFSSWQALLGLTILAGLVWIAVKKRRSLVGWSAVVFLAFYFIISNLIFKTGTIMAERLVYAASLGLVMLLALCIEHLRKKIGHEKVIYGALTIMLIFYGYKTINRNSVWISEERLFASAVVVAPESVVNRTNLAYLRYVQKDLEGAKTESEGVLAIAPDHVPALNLAAQSNKKLGNPKVAEDYWKRAIELRPDYVRGYLGLGVLYYENGHFPDAELILTKAVNIFPRWSEVLFLSLTKTALKKYDEAIAIVIQHFGEDPERPDLIFALGVAYYKKGDREHAMKYLRKVQNPNLTQEQFLQTIEKNTIFLITDL
ncbi:MAG: tetratricopeptide repeat protein [Patescibacteria group bacterium]